MDIETKKRADTRRARLDKWLWCARFYKSREQAAAAVVGGKVHLNGARVKPAHGVAVGDRLVITQGPIARELVVLGLPARRGPAPEAELAFRESDESKVRRERLKEQHALAAAITPRPKTRPDKRERRLLHRLHRRQS